MNKINLKKPISILVFLLVSMAFLTQVYAGSDTVYLGTHEYSDSTDILYGAQGRWSYVKIDGSSDHSVYAKLWYNPGGTIYAKKSVLYNPGGYGSTDYYSGPGHWQLELNPYSIYKDCLGYGTLQTK